MKNLFMIKTGAIAFITMLACYALTGCTDNDVYNPEKGKPELKPESEYFDFATTGNVAFDVNYGKLAGGALLEFFTEDPISYNEDGSYAVNGEARYKIFADENGRFVGNVELPKAASKVYIYSPFWGAPMLVEANVENGQVIVDETEDEAETRGVATRVVNSPSVKNTSATNVYTIVSWTDNGKIKSGKFAGDFNKIVTTNSNINSDFITSVQKALWGGKTGKPQNLDNSGMVQETKHVNTTIAESYSYKNGKGETVTVNDADLYLTFLTESGAYQSTLGYYYYKTGTTPNLTSIKKYIIIPNASVSGNDPYTGGNKDNAPITKNTRVQLLFEDGNGEVSTKFPGGYTVGYFLISNSFYDSKNLNYNQDFIYSNAEWNKPYGEKQQKARFISYTAKTNKAVVYGVEDGVDTSYEDVLFCIDANPNGIIEDPNRNPEPEPEPEPTTETTYRTYAYEDIWPTGGDYDLNDVIIEHKSEVTFTEDNYITKVVDTFTPVQPTGSATYVDAFAVQYSQQGTISLPTDAINEKATGSIILFADARAVKGKEFVVTRVFTDKTQLKDKSFITDLNPFIISKYEEGSQNRTEVHLPKHKATEYANSDQFGKEDDAYYINKDGEHPFAIMIPEASDRYTPVTETVSIEKEYPKFSKWVESNGKTDGDWYLYYQTSKP